MKRLFSYLLFSLSCLMSFGQTKEEAISKMQIAAEESSRFLPQSMGFFTMDKIVVAGKHNGRSVPVTCTFPVIFNL